MTALSGGAFAGAVRSALATHARLAVPAAELADDSDLYAAGLTSHACVNVMLALEDAYGVEFPDRLLRRETFASIGALAAALTEAGAAAP